MLHLVSPWKDYWTGWSLGSLKPELFEVNDYTRLQSDTMLCKKATKWTKMSKTYTNRGQRGVTCLNLFRICNDHREGEKMNTVTGCKITTIQKGDSAVETAKVSSVGLPCPGEEPDLLSCCCEGRTAWSLILLRLRVGVLKVFWGDVLLISLLRAVWPLTFSTLRFILFPASSLFFPVPAQVKSKLDFEVSCVVRKGIRNPRLHLHSTNRYGAK